MNPKHVTKAQALLWFGVKKADQKFIRPMGDTWYIDPHHVMIVHIQDPDEPEHEPASYSGERDDTFTVPKLDLEMSEVTMPTEYLRAVLDNVTSDYIRLKVATDYPMIVESKIGDADVTVMIAPFIEPKE